MQVGFHISLNVEDADTSRLFKSLVCIVILKAITTKAIERGTLKNAINHSRRNPKRCLSNPEEGKKRETGMRTRGNK